jgi:hypothetical protein
MNEKAKSRVNETAASSSATLDDSTTRRAEEGAFEQAKEAVTGAAREISDIAKDAAGGARDKAEDIADRGKLAGADQMTGFARAARGAADDLEKQSPEVASYVRQAADGLERTASSVRGRSIGEFVEMIDDFARRQPAAFFGGTVLAGFVLSRFVKSRADRNLRTSTPWSRPAANTSGAVRPQPMSSSNIGEMPS